MINYKAVFLDRDGIINYDNSYVHKISDFEFVEGIFDLLIYLMKKDFKLFIVTNQSGIGRGYYTDQDFKVLNQWMLNQFENKSILISEVKYCPHKPEDECLCRKPKPKLVNQLVKKYSISKEQSWFIGDKISDIECAINSKIQNTILINTDYNKILLKPTYAVNNINEVKNII